MLDGWVAKAILFTKSTKAGRFGDDDGDHHIFFDIQMPLHFSLC